MSKIENTGKVLTEKADHFLSDKPIWFWWGAYILLMAVVFAIFYLVISFLTGQWWVVAVLAVVVGFIWGTVAYTNRKSGKKSA